MGGYQPTGYGAPSGQHAPESHHQLLATYQNQSHQTLYDWLRAGDPGQVGGLTAKWHRIAEGLYDLHHNLDTELAAIDGKWTSASGDEYQRRMGLVSRYAEDLAYGIANVQTSVDGLNSELRKAQDKMESPEETDDHDSMVSGVAKGSVFGVAGMVAGGIVGYQQDEEQKKAARNRMVRLVTALAGDYQPICARVDSAPESPADLPGDDVHPVPVRYGAAPGSGGTSAVPGSNPDVATHQERGRFDITAPDMPRHGTDAPPGTPPAAPGMPGTPGTDPVGSSGLVPGSSPDGTALQGVGGGPVALGGPGVAGTPALGTIGTAGTGLASAPVGAGWSATSALDGGVGQAPGEGAATSRAGRGVLGTRRGTESEPEEYTTWLTEDDMVWGGDEKVAPGVLGGCPRADAQP